MASAPTIPAELSVRAPAVDATVVKPTPLEAAGFTATHIGIALFIGLGAAALIVGLSLGFALPRPTTTNTVTVPVVVSPDWATFPAEEGAHWDYDTHSAIGPAKWGTITKNSSTKELYYPICAQTSQSPINIVTSAATVAATATYNPKRFYNATSFKIAARPGGHPGFAVSPINGTAVWMVDGVAYNLLQFHYHSPSEHTVDGVRFPLEVHFVHQSASGALAVFGILFPYSEDGIIPNPFITQWWDTIYTEVRTALQGAAAAPHTPPHKASHPPLHTPNLNPLFPFPHTEKPRHYLPY